MNKTIPVTFIIIFTLLFSNCNILYSNNQPKDTLDSGYNGNKQFFNFAVTLFFRDNGYGDRMSFTLPLNLFFERMVLPYLSVGGFVGYTAWNYGEIREGKKYPYTFSYLPVGAKTSLHYPPFLNKYLNTRINLQQWDLYLSFILGAENRFYNPHSSLIENEYKDYIIQPLFGATGGITYYLNESTGIYLEGGMCTFGYCKLGMAFRF